MKLKKSDKHKLSNSEFIHRELSWLDFNLRVLAEAENPEVPLLERLKFIAIVSSNLDEFITVHVARVMRQVDAIDPLTNLPMKQIIAQISERIRALVNRQNDCLHDVLLPALAKQNIYLSAFDTLAAGDLEYLQAIYENKIAPILTPLAIDLGHPFPLLASGALYLLFRVKSVNPAENIFSTIDTILMQVPGGLDRFYDLPTANGETRLITLEDIIRLFAPNFLSGYEVEGIYLFRVLRDAQTIVDDEANKDLLGAVDEAVRGRRWGLPIALEASVHIPQNILQFVCEKLSLNDPQFVFRVPRPLGLKGFFNFVSKVKRDDLMEPLWLPQAHPLLAQEDIFAALRRDDYILQLPYQQFDPIIKMVEKAVTDPQVLAIKITLYRVAGDSPLIKALIRAAKMGKQVTALVELRARFDEHNNITWARALDAAGAHIIYGVVGYKTHSKVMLVVRQEEEGIRRYVHLATGNYNDKTARTYTDISLFTANAEIGRDISSFFNVITGYSLPPDWQHITMAPTDLRKKILSLIEREISKHSSAVPSFIRVKMNSCVDTEVISALYRASKAGVKIDLLVRGMCSLRAGVKGLSENIRVRSILDRYLEHARIFHFHNGGDEEVYVSSADWMERNFDDRLELMFPLLKSHCRDEALQMLNAGFKDNVKAWEMKNDGTYHRVERPKNPEKHYRSQAVMYKLACKSAQTQIASDTDETKMFIARTAQAQA